MTVAQQKIVQYLAEAQATELALVRVLQEQIAVTPTGSYRSGLETHLAETRSHAKRVASRLGELGHGDNPVQAVVGLVEALLGQALALGKTPLDLLRGSGGEEKVLKNAKDACATEALEIATYTTLERLATAAGDEQTAKLAASIRADEERMLDRVLGELPQLTDAVMAAAAGDGSYDAATTGAGQAVRATGAAARETGQRAGAKAKRSARQARKVPGVARAEGEVKGALAGEEDLAIARYGSLTVDEVNGRLPGLSQIELAKVDAYERAHENRSTILDRVDTLTGNEPWPGYDEQTAAEVTKALAAGDDGLADRVRGYERSHKDRAGVMKAATTG